MDQTTDSPAIIVAVRWIEQVLSGSAATAFATIALASLGFLMLSGRMELRKAGSALLGCFMIFGAPSIATGILATSQRQAAGPVAIAPSPPIYRTEPVKARSTPAAPGNSVYMSASLPPQ